MLFAPPRIFYRQGCGVLLKIRGTANCEVWQNQKMFPAPVELTHEGLDMFSYL